MGLFSALRPKPMIYQLQEAPTSTLVWRDYTEADFKSLTQSGRPTLLDFWAEWCGPCHMMEEMTFQDPKVFHEIQNWNLVRFDATKPNEETKKMMSQFSVKSLPTLIFIDEKGKEILNLRLEGYEEAEQFLQRLRKGFVK